MKLVVLVRVFDVVVKDEAATVEFHLPATLGLVQLVQ
jgi:hypothetical protein